MLLPMPSFHAYLESSIEKFPKIKQSFEYSCGAASLLAVLKFYGIHDYTEKDLMNKLYTHPSIGTHTANFEQLCRDLRLDFTARTMTTDDLIHYAQAHIPVIVLYQGARPYKAVPAGKDWSHYGIVIGFNPKTERILIHDPWDKKRLSYPIDDFNDKWNGLSEFDHYGIIIRGVKSTK